MTPRVRLRFSKLGKIRFTSHRDVARIWERTLRRAGVPIAYSEGFSPRPKLSFGLALSTGHESLGEYLDIALRTNEEGLAVAQLAARLAPVLPEGIDAMAAERLAPGAVSLQQAVTSCTWHIEVMGVAPPAVASVLARALVATDLTITRQRKGHSVTDDVRPAILGARVVGPTDSGTEIDAELATEGRALRPAEFVAALDPTWPVGRVVRINQWTLTDGARREVIPLPSAATPVLHAKARAS